MARWCPNWHMLDFHESWNCGNMITKNTYYSEVDKNIRTCNTFIVKPNSNQERHYITTIVQQTLPPFHFISCDQKTKRTTNKNMFFVQSPLSFLWFSTLTCSSIPVLARSPDTRMMRGCTEASNDWIMMLILSGWQPLFWRLGVPPQSKARRWNSKS